MPERSLNSSGDRSDQDGITAELQWTAPLNQTTRIPGLHKRRKSSLDVVDKTRNWLLTPLASPGSGSGIRSSDEKGPRHDTTTEVVKSSARGRRSSLETEEIRFPTIMMPHLQPSVAASTPFRRKSAATKHDSVVTPQSVHDWQTKVQDAIQSASTKGIRPGTFESPGQPGYGLRIRKVNIQAKSASSDRNKAQHVSIDGEPDAGCAAADSTVMDATKPVQRPNRSWPLDLSDDRREQERAVDLALSSAPTVTSRGQSKRKLSADEDADGQDVQVYIEQLQTERKSIDAQLEVQERTS